MACVLSRCRERFARKCREGLLELRTGLIIGDFTISIGDGNPEHPEALRQGPFEFFPGTWWCDNRELWFLASCLLGEKNAKGNYAEIEGSWKI